MTAVVPAQGPVLVFDSGSGGLSVWDEIRQRRPDLSTVYGADFAGFPYGTRTDADLEARVTRLLEQWIPRFQPSLVVVACNTASTLVLEHLRQHFAPLPFVGVVPAIKTAAARTRSGRIALLATPATVTRPYIDRLVASFAADHTVIKLGQGDLVRIAEAKIRGQAPGAELAPIVDQIAALNVDTVVLGCTHFPLLTPEFSARLPQIQWIDSGEAIARRVDSLLPKLSPGAQGKQVDASHRAVYTGPEDLAWERGLRHRGFAEVECLRSGESA